MNAKIRQKKEIVKKEQARVDFLSRRICSISFKKFWKSLKKLSSLVGFFIVLLDSRFHFLDYLCL